MKFLRVAILLAATAALGTGCWTTNRILHELRWSGPETPPQQPLPETEITPG
jgi:hypothetical protein